MTTIYTVNSKALLAEAAQIERDAEQSLKAWILIGEGERYGEAMKTVTILRRVAAEKSIWLRREILRNCGYTIASPKTILASHI